jgi:hypothetical protein
VDYADAKAGLVRDKPSRQSPAIGYIKTRALDLVDFVGFRKGGTPMSTILVIILILLLIGALPTWPYSSGWGYYPSGGLGLVVLILIILALMGRI